VFSEVQFIFIMRKVYLLILFTFFFFATLPARETQLYNPFIDVQHYAFTIELNDLNDEIKADAVIKVRLTWSIKIQKERG
jgi:hypothetical protein